jgi:hypothetical protein
MNPHRAKILGVVLATLTLAGTATAATDAPRLSWLAGCWTGEAGGVTTEEHWTSPAGGALVGMNKAVKGDAMVSFEFLRIEPQDGRLCYLSSPGGAPVTSFCAIEVSATRAVFENREHDFPQRIVYRRDGDRLHARIEGTLDGKQQGQDWEWRRCEK